MGIIRKYFILDHVRSASNLYICYYCQLPINLWSLIILFVPIIWMNGTWKQLSNMCRSAAFLWKGYIQHSRKYAVNPQKKISLLVLFFWINSLFINHTKLIKQHSSRLLLQIYIHFKLWLLWFYLKVHYQKYVIHISASITN